MPSRRIRRRAPTSALLSALLLGLGSATPNVAAAETRDWVSALSVFGDTRGAEEPEVKRAIYEIVADDDLRLEGEDGEQWVPAIAMIGEVVIDTSEGTAAGDGAGEATVPAFAVLSLPNGAADAATESVILASTEPAQSYASREKSELERWVPGFSLESGVMVQKVEAAVSSGAVLGPAFGYPGQILDPLRPFANGDTRMVTPWVGADAEIMTPGLLDIPGSPRAFAHVGAAGALSNDRDVAKEGEPSAFMLAEGVPVQQDDNIRGQGGKVRATVQPLVVSAGAGVAFTLDAWGRTVRIKPSVEYLREVVEITGQVKRAVQVGGGPAGARNLSDFRLVTLRSTDEKVFHGLGPGLSVEADTGHVGPFLLTVYFSGTGYKILNDRMIKLTSSNGFGETASFRFETNDWTYRGGMGLRFRWVPD